MRLQRRPRPPGHRRPALRAAHSAGLGVLDRDRAADQDGPGLGRGPSGGGRERGRRPRGARRARRRGERSPGVPLGPLRLLQRPGRQRLGRAGADPAGLVRVLFASTRGVGHFNPLVPFVELALRVGHEVMVAGPPALAPTIEPTGYPFWQGENPPADELDATWARVPQVPREQAEQIVIGEIFARLNVRAMLPSLRAAIAEWKPDLVIHEQAEFASAIAAHEAGVPHARLGISLTALDRSWLEVAGPGIEEQQPGIAEVIWDSPYLTLFPAALDDPEAKWPSDVRRFR